MVGASVGGRASSTVWNEQRPWSKLWDQGRPDLAPQDFSAERLEKRLVSSPQRANREGRTRLRIGKSAAARSRRGRFLVSTAVGSLDPGVSPGAQAERSRFPNWPIGPRPTCPPPFARGTSLGGREECGAETASLGPRQWPACDDEAVFSEERRGHHDENPGGLVFFCIFPSLKLIKLRNTD